VDARDQIRVKPGHDVTASINDDFGIAGLDPAIHGTTQSLHELV
jgi:hypothetical protein